MASEQEGNRGKGQQQQGGGQHQQPEKKPQAAPSEIAKLIGQVSQLLEHLYPLEQARVLRGVAITNNLAEVMGGKK